MRDIILHCHLFKNAGSTIDWALRNSFGAGFVDHRDDQPMRKKSVEYLDDYLLNHESVCALSSHHIPFVPEHNASYKHILMIRAPLLRAKSVYNFERKQPVSSLGSEMAKKLSASEYIMWRMRGDVPPVINNFQVRYMTGILNPARQLEESHLEEVFKRIELGNVFVGAVEKFDESMVVFEGELEKHFPTIDLSYIRQNDSNMNDEDVDVFLNSLTEEAREVLVKQNRLDMLLYDKVNKIVREQIKSLHKGSEVVTRFENRCLSKLEEAESEFAAK